MKRFNYLDGSASAFIERVRGVSRSERLRTPLCAVVTAAAVVFAWWGIERHLLDEANAEMRAAQLRFDRDHDELARVRLIRSELQGLVRLDVRIRMIRRSGADFAVRVAGIANDVPDRAWLTTLNASGNDLSLSGHAAGFAVLRETLQQVGATVAGTRLVRATQEVPLANHDAVLAFEMAAKP